MTYTDGDLWTAATHDHDGEVLRGQVTASRVALASTIASLCEAGTEQGFSDLLDLSRDTIERVVARVVGDDPVQFAVVHSEVMGAIREDWRTLRRSAADGMCPGSGSWANVVAGDGSVACPDCGEVLPATDFQHKFFDYDGSAYQGQKVPSHGKSQVMARRRTAAGIAVIPDNVGGRDFIPEQAIGQINRMTLLAISGGRVGRITKGNKVVGLTLPVSQGYSVDIYLANDDTYTVQRVFRGKVKGEQTGVYADELDEAAYQASSYRSNDFGGHKVGRRTALTRDGFSYHLWVPSLGTNLVADGFASLDEAAAAAEAAVAGVDTTGLVGFLNKPGGDAYSWSPKTASRRTTSVALTNVGFEERIGGDLAHGTTSDGRKVIFRLSPEDAKNLAWAMTSDAAVNFSGVDVDESDIVSMSSRRQAAVYSSDEMQVWLGDTWEVVWQGPYAQSFVWSVHAPGDDENPIEEGYLDSGYASGLDRVWGDVLDALARNGLSTSRTSLGTPDTFVTAQGSRRTAAESASCESCGAKVGPYEQFPNGSGEGILCLDCYAASPEGQRMPTADEVVEMWGGPVRRTAARDNRYSPKAPDHFVADGDRFDKALAKFVRTKDDFSYIDPSAPSDLVRAYKGWQQMGYANGYFAYRRTALQTPAIERRREKGITYFGAETVDDARQAGYEDGYSGHPKESGMMTFPGAYSDGYAEGRREWMMRAMTAKKAPASRISWQRTALRHASGPVAVWEAKTPVGLAVVAKVNGEFQWSGERHGIEVEGVAESLLAAQSGVLAALAAVVPPAEEDDEDEKKKPVAAPPAEGESEDTEESDEDDDGPAEEAEEMAEEGAEDMAEAQVAPADASSPDSKADGLAPGAGDASPVPNQTQEATDAMVTLTTMQPGDTASMSFTMADGRTGSVEVTFVRQDGNVFFLNGPTGEFGVGDVSGQWKDAQGNTFTFAPSGAATQAPVEKAPTEAPADEQPKEPEANPGSDMPWKKGGSRRTAAVDPELAARARSYWGGFGDGSETGSSDGFVSTDGFAYRWENDTTLVSTMDGARIKFRKKGDGWEFRDGGEWKNMPPAKTSADREREREEQYKMDAEYYRRYKERDPESYRYFMD